LSELETRVAPRRSRSGAGGLQRARVAAWISLYRALGGGWSAAEMDRQAAATNGARVSK
jgi:hypothetical protein